MKVGFFAANFRRQNVKGAVNEFASLSLARNASSAVRYDEEQKEHAG